MEICNHKYLWILSLTSAVQSRGEFQVSGYPPHRPIKSYLCKLLKLVCKNHLGLIWLCIRQYYRDYTSFVSLVCVLQPIERRHIEKYVTRADSNQTDITSPAKKFPVTPLHTCHVVCYQTYRCPNVIVGNYNYYFDKGQVKMAFFTENYDISFSIASNHFVDFDSLYSSTIYIRCKLTKLNQFEQRVWLNIG